MSGIELCVPPGLDADRAGRRVMCHMGIYTKQSGSMVCVYVACAVHRLLTTGDAVTAHRCRNSGPAEASRSDSTFPRNTLLVTVGKINARVTGPTRILLVVAREMQ